MSTIVFPSNTADIIDQIRGAIGRPVTFYVVASQGECPVCGVDPITNSARDPFCTTCSGIGYTYTYSGVTMSGHITWNYSEALQWVSGGKMDSGDCTVQVKYTVANLEAVDKAKYVIVDGKNMQIQKRTLRGVKDINRIIVDLMEREE